MNIKHYLSAFAALAMLAACSEYDPGMSDQVVDLTNAEIDTITKYTANFVQRYGEMDPDHTWGFGELAEKDEMETRAIQTERNMWVVDVKENNVLIDLTTTVGIYQNTGNPYYSPLDYTTNEGWIIPGFPSAVDGMYYIEESTGVNSYTKPQLIQKKAENPSTGLLPIGDVTDEEIEYVSWWFRTHPGPTTTTPPFTEYFVQDISQDYDRENYPSGDWKDFENGKVQVPVIFHDTNTNTEYQEETEGIGYDMDYFSVQTSDGAWEHNNNFNKGKANPIAESVPGTRTDTTALCNSTTTFPNRTLKYWTNNGPYDDAQDIQDSHPVHKYKDNSGYTTSFSYHNSDDNTDYQNYKLVHLQFYGPRTGKWYDGYYLGFDYELHKTTDLGNGQYKTTDVEPDGYYSNWIVKISPADPSFYKTKTVTHSRRVMCEDLGSTFDFDFNDLVFDVVYSRQEQLNSNNVWEPVNSNGLWDVTVTLQASGGTLPIYIKDFKEQKYNVHELFGCTKSSDGLYSPVNVGTGYTHDPVTLNFGQTASTNPEDIAILVYSKDAERSATHELQLPNPSGLQSFGTQIAPMKICVPTYVRWTKEYQQIEWAYPRFADWVTSESGTAGFGHENDWTLESVDSYLY